MVEVEAQNVLLQAIGARIRELRIEAGMSQETFALAAGISSKYAWRIEDGRQNLSLRSISRITIALNVPMSALFVGIEADPGTLGTRPYKRKSEDTI